MATFVIATTLIAWAVVMRYAIVNYLNWKQEKNS